MDEPAHLAANQVPPTQPQLLPHFLIDYYQIVTVYFGNVQHPHILIVVQIVVQICGDELLAISDSNGNLTLDEV